MKYIPLVYSWAKRSKCVKSKDDLECLVRRFPGISYSEIADCCKFSGGSVSNKIKELVDDNRIFKIYDPGYDGKLRSFYVARNKIDDFEIINKNKRNY